MDRDPVEPFARKATPQTPQLAIAADGVDAANRKAGERLEQCPPPGADGEPPVSEIGPDGIEDAPTESRPRPLQIEQELCLRSGSGEEVVQLQSRVPWGRELPPIPEDGERPDRLEVPHLEPIAMESDIGFDEGGAELLGYFQVSEAIARAVRDEERVVPICVRHRGGQPTHCHRV